MCKYGSESWPGQNLIKLFHHIDKGGKVGQYFYNYFTKQLKISQNIICTINIVDIIGNADIVGKVDIGGNVDIDDKVDIVGNANNVDIVDIVDSLSTLSIDTVEAILENNLGDISYSLI